MKYLYVGGLWIAYAGAMAMLVGASKDAITIGISAAFGAIGMLFASIVIAKS